jgi:hypothetical protein
MQTFGAVHKGLASQITWEGVKGAEYLYSDFHTD